MRKVGKAFKSQKFLNNVKFNLQFSFSNLFCATTNKKLNKHLLKLKNYNNNNDKIDYCVKQLSTKNRFLITWNFLSQK